MSTRIGEPSDPYEDEGLASPDPSLAAQRITGDPQDDMPVPADEPVAVSDYGTTLSEQATDEPLDSRLAREQPDLSAVAPPVIDDREGLDNPYPEDAEEKVGRLVESDEGVRADDEAEAVGHDVGTDQGGFSAEERAMHIEPEH